MRTAYISLLALVFTLALGGCSSAIAGKSARHVIMSAGSLGQETSWTPSEEEVASLERKLGGMFYTADPRLSGLPDGVPPYPLSDYYIRYIGTGPEENRYILGEAIHKTLPESEKLFGKERVNIPERGGPQYFTVMYDMNRERVTAVRFSGQ